MGPAPIQRARPLRERGGRMLDRITARARSAREMRLLLVEDDRMLGAGVERGLRRAGYAIDWVQDGDAAEGALATEPYDLVLLDLGLPRKSGLDVLRGLRRRGGRVP